MSIQIQDDLEIPPECCTTTNFNHISNPVNYYTSSILWTSISGGSVDFGNFIIVTCSYWGIKALKECLISFVEGFQRGLKRVTVKSWSNSSPNNWVRKDWLQRNQSALRGTCRTCQFQKSYQSTNFHQPENLSQRYQSTKVKVTRYIVMLLKIYTIVLGMR